MTCEENARLHALHALHIIDGPAEPHFDAICHAAKLLFDVPIALVTIVDERRVWFKARCGMAASEVSRDIGFCDQVIRSDEAFVVPDLAKDARFSDNPLVGARRPCDSTRERRSFSATGSASDLSA